MQDIINKICQYVLLLDLLAILIFFIGLVVYFLYATYKEFKPDGEK